jgi:hypothetical protein
MFAKNVAKQPPVVPVNCVLVLAEVLTGGRSCYLQKLQCRHSRVQRLKNTNKEPRCFSALDSLKNVFMNLEGC